MCACVRGFEHGKEHPPLVKRPEGISFMKSDNIQATPSSLFYKSSLTLINEVEMGREEGMGMQGRRGEVREGKEKLRAVLGDWRRRRHQPPRWPLKINNHRRAAEHFRLAALP